MVVISDPDTDLLGPLVDGEDLDGLPLTEIELALVNSFGSEGRVELALVDSPSVTPPSEGELALVDPSVGAGQFELALVDSLSHSYSEGSADLGAAETARPPDAEKHAKALTVITSRRSTTKQAPQLGQSGNLQDLPSSSRTLASSLHYMDVERFFGGVI